MSQRYTYLNTDMGNNDMVRMTIAPPLKKYPNVLVSCFSALEMFFEILWVMRSGGCGALDVHSAWQLVYGVSAPWYRAIAWTCYCRDEPRLGSEDGGFVRAGWIVDGAAAAAFAGCVYKESRFFIIS